MYLQSGIRITNRDYFIIPVVVTCTRSYTMYHAISEHIASMTKSVSAQAIHTLLQSKFNTTAAVDCTHVSRSVWLVLMKQFSQTSIQCIYNDVCGVTQFAV